MGKSNIVLSVIFMVGMIFSIGCSKNTIKTDSGYSVKTVMIGTQEWMSENLNVDHYRNGDSIPEVRDFNVWDTLTTGAWCYYHNDSKYEKTYGKLYNWYAVIDPRGLAPQGWHIPSVAEWYILSKYLGGKETAGGKLKDTILWKNPNLGATNESGFSAIPGGIRGYDGFSLLGEVGCFWSHGRAIFRYMGYGYSNFCRSKYDYKYGMSVRCIKDYPESKNKREDKNHYNYSSHNNFNKFWADFKRAVNEDDTNAILKMIVIPFEDNSGDIFDGGGGFVYSLGDEPGDTPYDIKSLTSVTPEEFIINYQEIFNITVKKTIRTAKFQTFGKWELDNYPVDKPGLYKINKEWFLLNIKYSKTDDTWIPAIILFGKINGIFKMSYIPYQV